MNINNISIVRATNVIPFDGVVRPISSVPYLVKKNAIEFSCALSDLLKEEGIIPTIDFERINDSEYFVEYGKLCSHILKEYLPYVSDYNSMVLFSLNGLCPDDSEHGFENNTFSNKKCAVIDALSNHMENVVSLCPTDTAIKGEVYLSNNAVILIEKNYYESLSTDDKKKLCNLNVKTFVGSLRDAVYNELLESKIYIPETLSLTAGMGGFLNSETSEMQKKCLEEIRKEYGVSNLRYFNLITSNDINMIKYDEVSEEYRNMVIVQDYFVRKFLDRLLSYLNASISYKEKLNYDNFLHSVEFMSDVVSLIKEKGVKEYKDFVLNYNQELEYMRDNYMLEKPEDIVSDLNTSKIK